MANLRRRRFEPVLEAHQPKPSPDRSICTLILTIWGDDDLTLVLGVFGLRCFRLDGIARKNGRSGATTTRALNEGSPTLGVSRSTKLNVEWPI